MAAGRTAEGLAWAVWGWPRGVFLGGSLASLPAGSQQRWKHTRQGQSGGDGDWEPRGRTAGDDDGVRFHIRYNERRRCWADALDELPCPVRASLRRFDARRTPAAARE